ncbi:hypothetical protein ASPWEDRAFT_81145, partial [Aspergillus wentii DTO 134E9]
RTLLHWAAIANCTNLIGYLIQNGAQIDVVDQNKRTPLSCAAEHGALQAVKLLFDNGANINSEDDEWGTPLMHAMDAGYPGAERDAMLAYLRSKNASYQLKHPW